MTDSTPADSSVYVSITGLELKKWWHLPLFWRHAIPSMVQARKADGNISADARKINGVYHTVTVWQSERAMKRFLYQGAHGRAIRAFPSFATGKTFGYLAGTAPDWSDVPAFWAKRGRPYAR